MINRVKCAFKGHVWENSYLHWTPFSRKCDQCEKEQQKITVWMDIDQVERHE